MMSKYTLLLYSRITESIEKVAYIFIKFVAEDNYQNIVLKNEAEYEDIKNVYESPEESLSEPKRFFFIYKTAILDLYRFHKDLFQ
jgi:hypothetical protein